MVRIWSDADRLVGDVCVADRCGGREGAVFRFFRHALPNLLGEVLDVVLRHEDLDAVEELLRRMGRRGDDGPLFHEIDLDLEVVESDPVRQVSVEAVGPLDYRVPKKDLVSVTRVLLQTGRPRIARALPHAELLARELMNFRSRVTAQTVESQLDWRERANDDLVLALAIASWQAERDPGLSFSCSYGISEMDRWGGI